MKINFNNIFNQDKVIIKKILKDLTKIIKKSNFILGSDVTKFEKNFSKYTKTKYCISCASGSDALYLALKSLNLNHNNEVIVPAMTYVATASSVINAGCKLRFADVNIKDASINQEDVIKKINSRTKAIIIVNLWGHCADYSSLKKLCEKKNITLIEDAAQSIGAYNSKKINSGNLGHIACFSFFPGKNLGAYGDGGAVVTNNKNIYEKVLQLRTHGARKKFQHDNVGINSRLDTIQASILNHKLKRIDKLNSLRRKIAKLYFQKIKNKKLYLFNIDLSSCFHQFVVLPKNRKHFTNYLKINNIPFGFHYPYSLNKLRAFKNYCIDKNLRNSETIGARCVSLPIDPYLNKKQLIYIINKVNSY
jgi:UDP-2-acetamido-2-deoxy-ribo-hexuluronate aminotransferase